MGYDGAVRRIGALALCLALARALAACGDGNVMGTDDPGAGGPPKGDDWNELTDDAGCMEKGACPDVSARDAGVDVSARDVTTADATVDRPRVDAPAAPDPCAMREEGYYCAALLGLPTAGLLRCAMGRSMGVTPCPGGCVDRPGGTDACLDDTIDACFDERDGLYCGRSIGNLARPNDAVRCLYRRTVWTGMCPGGCSMSGATVTCAP